MSVNSIVTVPDGGVGIWTPAYGSVWLQGIIASTRGPENGSFRLSEQAMLDREAGRRHERGDLQLAVDRAQVTADRARAQNQPLGNLCVAQALRDEPQHLDLALGQIGRVGRRGG